MPAVVGRILQRPGYWSRCNTYISIYCTMASCQQGTDYILLYVQIDHFNVDNLLLLIKNNCIITDVIRVKQTTNIAEYEL